jgi:hypothetical protein
MTQVFESQLRRGLKGYTMYRLRTTTRSMPFEDGPHGVFRIELGEHQQPPIWPIYRLFFGQLTRCQVVILYCGDMRP